MGHESCSNTFVINTLWPLTKKAYETNKEHSKVKEGAKTRTSYDWGTKANAGILDLSFDFACRITRLYQYLTEDSSDKEFVMSKQVYRSGTSIGANAREAKHAQSDADFLNKYSISYKEADETDYWLNLLHANGYLTDEAFNSLNHDMTRILKVLTAIVKKLKEKINKK